MAGLFEQLSADEREALIRHTTTRRFSPNEVVLHEGDPADALHIVEHGLFAARSSSTLGHVLTVNVFGPGAVFGELALLTSDAVRSATVVSLRAGQTRMLRRAGLELLRSSPAARAFDRYLLTTLAERNIALTQQLIELLFVPAGKRIQRQLLRLAELGIGDDGDGWIRLSQDELAMLTGTTRATVNRVVRDLERRGVVELARGRSRIVDAPTLARLAS
jgi:CRP-like cAMP-binding protein